MNMQMAVTVTKKLWIWWVNDFKKELWCSMKLNAAFSENYDRANLDDCHSDDKDDVEIGDDGLWDV